MKILKLEINEQQIKKIDSAAYQNIIAGTKGYVLFKFYFKKGWEKCNKIAIFKSGEKEVLKKIVNNTCYMPEEFSDEGMIKLSVVGKRKKENYIIKSESTEIMQRR